MIKNRLRVVFLIMGPLTLSVGFGLGSRAVASKAPSTVAATTAGLTIAIDNFNFAPAVLTVPAGATVVWTNHDDLPHNVVERNQKFKSKALDTDETFSYTFAEPGTYEYFCGLHPKMVGKVIVEAKK